MNEAVQVLNQTNSERKTLGRSANHKKNGSAVAKLGNKPMSWQEIRSKNGPCKTHPSTDCFMEYADFEELPNDLKVEFVNKMMDKYDIGLSQISQYLFNKGGDGLKANLRNNYDILDRIDYKKARANTGLLKFRSEVDDWKKREKAAKLADEAAAQRKRNIIWNAKFINYHEFLNLPIDGQVSYINNLIKKHNVSCSTISEYLFKVNPQTFRYHLKKNGVLDQIDKSKGGYPARCIKQIEAFDRAVKEWRGELVMEEVPVQNTIDETPKEEAQNIAHEIVLSIAEHPAEKLHEMAKEIIQSPVKEEPVVPEVYRDPIERRVEEFTKQFDHAAEKPMTMDEFEEAAGLPKIDLEFKTPWEEAKKPTDAATDNSHSTVFTSNYKSIGLDSDELDGMKLMFKNKMIEVCITVRTV